MIPQNPNSPRPQQRAASQSNGGKTAAIALGSAILGSGVSAIGMTIANELDDEIVIPVEDPVNNGPVTDNPAVVPAAGDTPAEQPEEPVQIADPEDPSAVAEAIISDVEIDQQEFREGSQYEFQYMEHVYNDDGSEGNVAVFVDEYGREGVMVDIDNDGYFDAMQYLDCGEVAAAGHLALSVTDVEEQITSGYIAPDDSFAQIDEPTNDDYLNDVITTDDPMA